MYTTVNDIPTHSAPYPQLLANQLENSVYQDNSFAHLAPSSPPQLPRGEAALSPYSLSAPPPHTYLGQGMFAGSHHFSLLGNNTFIDNSNSSDDFMKDFLQHTIIGAEFDSSARDPPPRCHPGTRLAIQQRCLDFILECSGEEKLRWVVGPAGVGKSAVMQIVTEKTPEGVVSASVFLSVNGRRDGTKTIATIAYQFAAKCEPYYQFVQKMIIRDPSLLQKSLSVHFQKFIVEPFIRQRLFDTSHRFLIVIDGLDECDSPVTQRNLLELISDFCITYPTSNIVWIIASRPEPHLTSFFERVQVQPALIKEEMMINSDEACQDVQRYLRDELKKIKLEYASLRHKREWPSEHEFTQIASAAGGLFAYAATVVRYIGDPHYRGPATRLRHVLETIAGGPHSSAPGGTHPMAQLDALYARILSNIPVDVVDNTRKLMLLYSKPGWPGAKFREQCNRLGLTEDAAYAAICHLHAVMRVPEPDKADLERPVYFHKSIQDFLFDFNRSGFFLNAVDEAQQLKVQIAGRITEGVRDTSDDMMGLEGIECSDYGCLGSSAGFCESVPLSWPGDERFQITDDQLRVSLYRDSMVLICLKFSHSCNVYGTMSCFHSLTTRFTVLGPRFPLYELQEAVFGKFRHELAELGKLKQVPLRTLDYAAICGDIELRFTSPVGMTAERSGAWNSTCKHAKHELEGSEELRGWTTHFERFDHSGPRNLATDNGDGDLPRFRIVSHKTSHEELPHHLFSIGCSYCLQRFARHLISNADESATIFVDSTEMCYVEVSFVDPDDGVSEWRYRFLHSGPPACIDV